MYALIVFALVACAAAVPAQQSSYGRGYGSAGIDDSKPYPGCKNNGDILRDPTNRCQYLECHLGEEPWFDAYGRAQLYIRSRPCPPGTGVAAGYGKDLLFSPIQNNPVHKVGYQQPSYGYGQKVANYRTYYHDMTAICSELVKYGECGRFH